ncbi:hypothetical protein OH76DRAFT_1456691 [Lentinus brumalis]|uniref:CxC1-like cysteine cluster associated with KDZ transposases domain-containing protein n=1 Tax=Lentinus brumalis TaxID=2498619 RepID=A0A371D545_9APHY|nr:hypothetical protein OH76DRAFT_1456691 [Polyporus brumalis]
MDVIDMVTLEKRKCFPRAATQRTTTSIAESGFLPASPVDPSLAVSFRTLEYFRRLRLRKASYSVEAFAKVICDLYGIPYRRRFRTAISDTYDVYLSILRIVDGRVKAYLGEDGPNWRVKNSCPACSCKLEGEPDLDWDRMFCIDGNNSLKRIAKIGDREIADRREFTASDYYLLEEYVDRFKDEVKSTRGQDAGIVEADSDSEWEDDQEEQGTPADFAGADDILRQCTQNWKAAAKDEKKKMWSIFEETGVFASACRHGFILWVVDMVRSGELAKYALAVVAKALEVFDDRLLIGYDIGCTFDGTIKRSSLGPEFVRLQCRCCVNAFHGYSHSHSCQTVNHPSVIKGAGLEDFEGMERAFSASNELAPITRYASKYHRRMHIDRHYAQWDEDKYANLGTMLYNNYRQALAILEQEVPLLEQWLRDNACQEQDLEAWQREEAEYFATIGKVTEVDQFAVEYVARLREYWALEDRAANSMSAFVTSIPEDYQPASRTRSRRATTDYLRDASDTLKRETEMRFLRERRDSALRDVIALELRMGIETRWTPSTPRFIETAQYVTERDYRLALEELHRLVVQRLFELQSMNLSHTAYKVRVSIAKSLQRRSKAIRRALRAYNQAAAKLVPARPPLDWSKVSHYAFIEEFELLRDTRNDLQDKRWAQSNTREYMKKSRNIRRAREEISRCNLEVRRVHTHVVLENEKLDKAVQSSLAERNPISGAIAEYRDRRKAVNERLLAVIRQIYALKGFTGNPTPGRREGTSISAAVDPEDSSDDGEDDEADEERQAEAMRMLEFANSLT